MLKQVKRAGYIFWEAAPAPGRSSAKSKVSQEASRLGELLGLAPQRIETVWNGELEGESDGAARLLQFPEEYRSGSASGSARYDPTIWGDLAYLSDEDPELSVTENGAEKVPLVEIQEIVRKTFRVSKKEFNKGERGSEGAQARLASMALCRALTVHTVEEIAQAHGRDVALVSRACARFQEKVRTDAAFAARVIGIRAALFRPVEMQVAA